MRLLAAEGIRRRELEAFGMPLDVAEPQPGPSLGDVIVDAELRERCGDLLLAGGKFDRAIREAAVVLEDRVRTAVGGSERLGISLMGYAFSEKNPRLRLSQSPREQIGAMQLYAGVMAFFRNPTGHQFKDAYTRDDAVRFVAMVDLLLQMTGRAERTDAS